MGVEYIYFLHEYYGDSMKLKIIVHEAEEGGYWAEVLSINQLLGGAIGHV